jgi:hypothetical protein
MSEKTTPISDINTTETENDIKEASKVLHVIFSGVNGKYEGLFNHLHAATENEEEFSALLALLGTGLVTEDQLSIAISRVKNEKTHSLMVRTWVNAIVPPSKDSCIKIMNDFAEKDLELIADVMLNKRDYFPHTEIAKFIVDNARKGITMKLAKLLAKGIEKLKKEES